MPLRYGSSARPLWRRRRVLGDLNQALAKVGDDEARARRQRSQQLLLDRSPRVSRHNVEHLEQVFGIARAGLQHREKLCRAQRGGHGRHAHWRPSPALTTKRAGVAKGRREPVGVVLARCPLAVAGLVADRGGCRPTVPAAPPATPASLLRGLGPALLVLPRGKHRSVLIQVHHPDVRGRERRRLVARRVPAPRRRSPEDVAQKPLVPGGAHAARSTSGHRKQGALRRRAAGARGKGETGSGSDEHGGGEGQGAGPPDPRHPPPQACAPVVQRCVLAMGEWGAVCAPAQRSAQVQISGSCFTRRQQARAPAGKGRAAACAVLGCAVSPRSTEVGQGARRGAHWARSQLRRWGMRARGLAARRVGAGKRHSRVLSEPGGCTRRFPGG